MQTNNHLKTTIKEMANFMTNHSPPPEDLAFKLIFELRVSRLLIPADIDGDDINFPNIMAGNGDMLLPLFTDEDELLLYSHEFTPLENDLEFYRQLVMDSDFEGALINTESDEFFVDRVLLEKITPLENGIKGKGYSIKKLQKLSKKPSNDKLLGFIRNESNFNRYDDAAYLLRDSVLLNAIVYDEALDEAESQGIVRKKDVGGFVPESRKSGREVYGIIYTDLDSIPEDTKYYQVCNLYEVIKFFLSSDMDGIIVNPDDEEYYLPRNLLLDMLGMEGIINPKFSKATEYAFRM